MNFDIKHLYYFLWMVKILENDTKKEINIKMGKVLKEYRLKMNLTQAELAKKLEVTEKYISRIENGLSGVGTETLIKFINILCIAPNTLYQDLITNENIKKQIEISKMLNKLPQNKLDFLKDFIKLLENKD